jgi:N-formylglutamate amidohydrolase
LKNLPYAGGHVTARHGNPNEGVHALQLEIDRSLYLDPMLRSPGSGFDRVAKLIAEVTMSLAHAALQGDTALAAE